VALGAATLAVKVQSVMNKDGGSLLPVPPPEHSINMAKVKLPTVLTSTSIMVPGSPVITPPKANVIARTLWTMRQHARASLDLGEIDQIDSGIAKAYDTDIVRAEAYGFSIQGIPTGSANALRVYVPRQSDYPASFLFEVATASSSGPGQAGPLTQYISVDIAERKGPSTPWQVAFVGTFVPVGTTTTVQTLSPLPVGDNGFDPPPAYPPPSHPMTAIAAYWQHWVDHGTAPRNSPFMPSYWTTQFGAALASQHEGVLIDSGAARQYLHYSANPAYGKWVFSTWGGAPMVCGVVTLDQKFIAHPRQGGLLYQNSSRHNWGSFLRPGMYTSITDNRAHAVCMVVDPAGKIAVMAGHDFSVSMTGTAP
jgi:hypothetical protein